MKKERDKKIGEWLSEIWKKEKYGLISQRLAACLLGITDNAIKKAGDRGAIGCYWCENVRLYSFEDCLLYKETREKIIKEDETLAKLEKLKIENYDEWLKEIEQIEFRKEHAFELAEIEAREEEEYQEWFQSQYGEPPYEEELRLKELENEYLEEKVKLLEQIIRKERQNNRKNKPL